MNLYDFVQTITDKRLPQFGGAGIKRTGTQVHFGRGKGHLFLSQVLYVIKRENGKVSITNRAF